MAVVKHAVIESTANVAWSLKGSVVEYAVTETTASSSNFQIFKFFFPSSNPPILQPSHPPPWHRFNSIPLMETTLLTNYSDQEKGAYLGAIASLATADHSATPEELQHMDQLADAAGISSAQKEMVLRAATEMSGDELRRCLEILSNSELRFSLVTELIAFAKTDGNYDEKEKKTIEDISAKLGINQNQFSLLDHFVTKSEEAKETSEETPRKNILDSLGLGEKFKAAGIDMSSLTKGLLAIAAPLLLGKLFSGSRGRTGRMGSLTGGAGIGSLLSMLSMGRGFGSTGGLLGKILQRNKTW